MADEIIRELWKIKDDIASSNNYDLRKLVKYLQKKERNRNYEIVDLRSRKKTAVSFGTNDLRREMSQSNQRNNEGYF